MLIIVAVALFLLLPEPWNIIAGLATLVLWLFELYFWNRTVRGRRTGVGVETLIGRDAVANSALRPSGHVKLDGEIWAARCEQGASTGDPVRVVGQDRLTLIVEPAPRA